MSASSAYQDFGCRRTEMTHQGWVGRSQSLNMLLATWRQRIYAQEFPLEKNILSLWCKDDVNNYTFDDFCNNCCWTCLWLFNDFLKCTRKYCVDGSICHFKFPKVVLAHILEKVGILCIALLSVYSRTCLPIVIEIGLYLTDTQQKTVGTFFDTRCSSWVRVH